MSKTDIKIASEVLSRRYDSMLREMDSILHVRECSLGNYDYMIELAIKKGFKRIVDIGCVYGHQSILCENRIDYVGVDEDLVDFYNEDKYDYYVGKYPQEISFLMDENEIAVSNLAIGWNCYVNEEETEEQFKALSENFKACLLYIPTDREELLKKYFKNIKIYKKTDEKDVVHRILVPTAFYYCYN